MRGDVGVCGGEEGTFGGGEGGVRAGVVVRVVGAAGYEGKGGCVGAGGPSGCCC